MDDWPLIGALAPELTFNKRSFTFFPSRAFVRSVAQMGSTSTDAAEVKAMILSAWYDVSWSKECKIVQTHSDFYVFVG